MAKVSVKKLVEQANSEIVTINAKQALTNQANNRAVLVDIRDVRELNRDGRIKDAVHAPRGMLEFWFDIESQYHREIFAQDDKTYVFFCAMGWRSALATKSLKDMGFDNIAHIDGGFAALIEQGAQTEIKPPKTAR